MVPPISSKNTAMTVKYIMRVKYIMHINCLSSLMIISFCLVLARDDVMIMLSDLQLKRVVYIPLE